MKKEQKEQHDSNLKLEQKNVLFIVVLIFLFVVGFFITRASDYQSFFNWTVVEYEYVADLNFDVEITQSLITPNLYEGNIIYSDFGWIEGAVQGADPSIQTADLRLDCISSFGSCGDYISDLSFFSSLNNVTATVQDENIMIKVAKTEGNDPIELSNTIGTFTIPQELI